MRFEGILFDLDGTLLHTADDLGAALNYVLQQHGMSATSQADYTGQASNGAVAMLKMGFGQAIENHDLSALRGQFLSYYLDNIATHTRYYAQVAKTLTFLNEQQVPWGIVTNKPEYLTTALLKHFPLLENCHVVVGGDTVGIAKPDPKPMLHALERIGLAGNQCLYVGDAKRDIEAGQNVDMKTAAALYGYISAQDDPNSWQADYQLDSFGQLLELL